MGAHRRPLLVSCPQVSKKRYVIPMEGPQLCVAGWASCARVVCWVVCLSDGHERGESGRLRKGGRSDGGHDHS